MKRIIIVVFSICMTSGISAQQKKICSLQFHSIINFGLLEGQTGSAFQIQTINGVQHNSWFMGIGLGLDYYRYRTIPLFMDVRKEFGSSVNKFFAYADGGVNFCWLTDNEKTMYLTDNHYTPGFYTDLGLGYKILVGKNNHLILGLGYSLKKLKETYSTYNYFNPPDYPLDKEHIDYNLNRLTMKIGWEF